MKLALAALSLALAVSARAQTKPWLEGQHSGVEQPRSEVVKDASQWGKVWRETGSSAPAPRVDFSKECVVVVFLGQTETAGTKVASFAVWQLPNDPSRLYVAYRTAVSNKGFAAQVESRPYAMVKVRAAASIDVEPDSVVSIPEPTAPPAATQPSYDDKRLHALLEGAQGLTFDGKTPP